jgi:SSS family solute:Na+ symporter
MFFSKALRTAIALVAVAGFCLPNFSSNFGACAGLLGSVVGASVWFFLGNPYGIDNTYIAASVPIVVMGIDHLVQRALRPVAQQVLKAEAVDESTP